MLTLENLSYRQDGFSLTADWRIAPGEKVAILGPSGAGKSTLLSLIAGYLAPTSGRVLWEGGEITGAPPGARPLSMLFQDGNLFPHLNVRQNLGLGISPKLKLSKADEMRIDEVLDAVGLSDKGARRPAALSGGEQSRVALARALLRRRPLLLLDEPFAALGPALKVQMLALVERIAGQTGAAVLMVTHDPKDAERLCPLTVVLAEGVAQPPRPTGALMADPPEALRAYLGR